MPRISPQTRRPLAPKDIARLQRIRVLARALDSSLTVPGTQFRIGLDSLIGLAPVVGDLVGTALSAYLIRESARLGIPKRLVLRMLVNLAVDFAGGSIPLAGDVFDAVWKANLKNLELLERHLGVAGVANPEPGPIIDI